MTNNKFMLLNIQKFSDDIEAGTTIQINGSATLTDVDTSKESRVLRLLGQTNQNGTPTPSSPIPINVVSGDNEINICGKNLFDKSSTPISNVSTTLSELDTGVRATITSAGSNRYSAIKIPNSDSLLGKTITVSATIAPSSTNNGLLRVYFLNGNSLTTKIGNNISATGSLSYDIPSSYPSGSNGIALVFSSNNNGTSVVGDYVDYTNVMVSIGEATYEPYIGNSYPIYLGVENLFDGVFRQGNISTLSNTTRVFSTQNLYLESGKRYTISTNLNTSLYKYAIALSDTTYPVSSGFYDSGWKTTSSFTFTPSRSGYFGLSIAKSNGTDSLTPNDIANYTWQLEKGSKANHYTPYGTTPIELCKIGTYQDYIYKEDGSWYLHKEIGKVVLDGSENWDLAERSETYNGVFYLQNFLADNGLIRETALANYGIYSSGYSNKVGYFDIHYGQIRFYAYSNSATKQDWKDKLASNNLIIYGILATPTNTLIEDTTLIEQLEALQST